ncbi:hypothetical protein Tco_1050647 [Tanacetum coccineum]
MNVFVRIDFGSTIKLVPFDESQVVTFNGKFVCGFKNGDCRTGSQSDNTVSPHGFVIHGIEILKGNEKVTVVINVENWRIDNSRMLRRIVSLIERNASVSSTKSSIQSTFRSTDTPYPPVGYDVLTLLLRTTSSTKELITPFENPKRVFRSKRRIFETPGLVESSSPEFDLFSDIEEHSEEEETTKIITETMEQ